MKPHQKTFDRIREAVLPEFRERVADSWSIMKASCRTKRPTPICAAPAPSNCAATCAA